jgi:hypothetical protein
VQLTYHTGGFGPVLYSNLYSNCKYATQFVNPKVAKTPKMSATKKKKKKKRVVLRIEANNSANDSKCHYSVPYVSHSPTQYFVLRSCCTFRPGVDWQEEKKGGSKTICVLAVYFLVPPTILIASLRRNCP